MVRLALVAGLLLAPSAVAAEDRIPLRLAAGATVEREVGFARMHLCDDTSIVRAEMRDKTLETNVFVITGLRAGTTECRAGLEEDRPTFLFSITVVEADGKPARPPKKLPGPKTPAGPPPGR